MCTMQLAQELLAFLFAEERHNDYQMKDTVQKSCSSFTSSPTCLTSLLPVGTIIQINFPGFSYKSLHFPDFNHRCFNNGIKMCEVYVNRGNFHLVLFPLSISHVHMKNRGGPGLKLG